MTKDSDWLKEDAEKFVKESSDEIKTSVLALAETVMVLERDEDIEDVAPRVKKILEIFDLMYIDEEKAMQAALYIDEDDSTTFDAFHAALSEGLPILSSDEFYEDIDTETENFKNK